MSTRDDDSTARMLSLALAEEADEVDVSPHGLGAIQRRTDETARRRVRSRWVFGTVGAGLATAAAVTAVVLLSSGGPGTSPTANGPDGGPSTGVQQVTPAPSPAAHLTMTMYYVGPRRSDPRLAPYLYPEKHTITQVGPVLPTAAVHEFLTSSPHDPDYRTGWPKGVDVEALTTSHGVTTIALKGNADLGTQPLPVPFDPSRAVAVQALLETAGIHGRAQFTYNGHRLDLVLYGSASLRARPWASLRVPVSIDNVVNGQRLTSPVTIEVSGNTYEGNVGWQLLDRAGKKVADGYVTASQGTWTRVPVHLGALTPGTYTFRAFEPGAANGRMQFVDDKVFTVG
jgi:hypothetical protein